MPFIHITASMPLTTEAISLIRASALDAAEHIGKPRQAVMVLIDQGAALTKGDAPLRCVFCDVRFYGALDPAKADAFASELSAMLKLHTQADQGCVYLSISPMNSCYTDGQLPPGH